MQYWKLESDDPLYKAKFGDVNVRRFKVITDQQEQIGKVLDALVDEQQSLSLHVETGSWLAPEWLVVPLGDYQVQPKQRTLCLLSPAVARAPSPADSYPPTNGHSSETLPDPAHGRVSAESIPAPRTLDRRVDRRSVESRGVESHRRSSSPAQSGVPLHRAADLSPDLDKTPDDGETIRLLEERLLVEQHRRKVGEVVVHKVVDTHLIQVPVRRERLVVEQVSPERRQLAVVDLSQSSQALGQMSDQMSEAIQALEPGVPYQASAAQVDLVRNSPEQNSPEQNSPKQSSPEQSSPEQSSPVQNGGFTQAATLTSTQQFLAQLAQRPQLAKAKLRLVFEDPELQSYYQRWLDQG